MGDNGGDGLAALTGLYTGEGFRHILFVTVIIGGGAAWLTGRAIAQTWRPFWHLVLYTALLGAAVRYVHFALFEGTLLSPASYGIDTLYLMIVAALAWRFTRAAQMATQYYWLFERAGLLSWRPRPAAAQNAAGSGTESG